MMGSLYPWKGKGWSHGLGNFVQSAETKVQSLPLKLWCVDVRPAGLLSDQEAET